MSQKVFLLAAHSAWGGASNFNDMFNSAGYECVEILHAAHSYDYGSHMNDKKLFLTNKEDLPLISEKLRNARDAIFFLFDIGGVEIFCNFMRGSFGYLRDCRVNTFWSGTPYRREYEHYNKWREHMKVSPGTSYAMSDLTTLGSTNLPLYQPHDLRRLQYMHSNAMERALNKQESIVCHTPGKRGVANTKGTFDIRRILSVELANLAKLGFEVSYRQVGGEAPNGVLSHAETLDIKAASRIFIDKVGRQSNVNQGGGIGKSGLEALAMGIPTISSMCETRFEEPYEALQGCIIDGTEPTQWVPEIIQLLENKDYYDQWVENILLKNECIGFDSTLTYLEETMTR